MASKSYPVALGGMLAAVAVVLMCLGTIIPVATYAAPMLCILLGQMVRKFCGDRLCWAWYGAVAVLSLLLAPDKEAAAVFAALGYYPVVKPKLERRRLPWLWKLCFFNAVMLGLYWLLLKVIGMERLVAEMEGMGAAMTGLLLVLGNLTFWLLDRLLGMKYRKRR